MQIGNRKNLALAFNDFHQGISSYRIWSMLGWLEIKQRYRRSVLGPFWLTLSTGFMVGGMGPLYGRLLGQDIGAYFSYLAISFVMWMFIAGLVNEACTTFIAAEGFIKQIKLPLTVYVMRMVWRNLIILGHNAVILVLVALFWPPSMSVYLITVPLGIAFIALNGVWVGICFGLLCARFRDIPQIVASLVQVALFLTPVMWKSEMLGRNQWAAAWNPFYHFLEIVRAPLVAPTVNLLSWTVVTGITMAGFGATFLFFSRYRARLAYWV